MSSNLIAKRITDLLILAGFTRKQTIEELADHYLTHIEEEVKRGLNEQQAIRETFQEIANIDITHFQESKKKRNKKLLLVILIFTLGIGAFIYNSNIKSDKSNQVIAEIDQKTTDIPDATDPPSGSPIKKSSLDITSDFGLRLHPIMKTTQLHTGIDIKAKTGTPVFATAKGIVLEAKTQEKPGKYIIIQHESGYKTKYYHLSDWDVNEGQKVEKGDQIGKVGNSGMSFLPHLHYEVLKDEEPLTPKAILNHKILNLTF